MRTIKHPLSGALYDLTDDGTVEVTKDGRRGRFTAHGVWLAGELRQADPHLCLWIAGRTPARPGTPGAAPRATAS